MTWVDRWVELFGGEPTDRTSREVSVQDVLAELIAGYRAPWFQVFEPTVGGQDFLHSIARLAFADEPVAPLSWFVSEYALPVPDEWRAEIGVSYGCPDFACGHEGYTFVIELKTERGSYRRRQMSDYLRLARLLHPDDRIDMVFLGPTLPGDSPEIDERQRYAELTWSAIPDLLDAAWPGVERAERLALFLREQFGAWPSAPAAGPSPTHTEPKEDEQPESSVEDRIEAAVRHALAMVPSVAGARPGDKTERGIDVGFDTDESAQLAAKAVRDAIEAAGFADRVTVWRWRRESLGDPTTEAGRLHGRELRLAPRSDRATSEHLEEDQGEHR